MKLKTIDPHLLKDKDIAEDALIKLIMVKEELDDFIENLEMLSDKEFRQNMDTALEEYKRGETLSGTIAGLRNQSNDNLQS
ncbi:MAG: hypothetical protein KAU14_01520 [Thermoplasmata archaeon]|nr:hypothetical protein [Thermoplasmata archaeon]